MTNYKFNGKELDAEDGLNWMDYGARMYDGALARWNGVDALAEKYNSVTTYGYCSGNPVTQVDVDGNGWYSVTNPETGESTYEWSEKYHSKKEFKDNIKEIQDKHKGMKLEYVKTHGRFDGENYYNLFGMSASGKEANTLEKVDELFINYAKSYVDDEGVFHINKTNLGQVEKYNPNDAWNYCKINIGKNGETAEFPLSIIPTENWIIPSEMFKGGFGSTNTNRGMLGYKLPHGRYYRIYSSISKNGCGVIAFPSQSIAENFEKLYYSMLPYLKK